MQTSCPSRFARIHATVRRGTPALLGPLVDQDGTPHPWLRPAMEAELGDLRVHVRRLMVHPTDSGARDFADVVKALHDVVDGRPTTVPRVHVQPLGPPEVAFVSGHLDLTPQELQEHYVPAMERAFLDGAAFVVGDARGADRLAASWLADRGAEVTVFHMLERPRFDPGPHLTQGGYTDDTSRDAAMTAASTVDIAWVRPGRERSGTAKNLARRLRTA